MDNRRLILLFIFSFSLVMLWDAWQKYNHPPQPAQTASAPAATDVPTVSKPASPSAVSGQSAVPTSDAAQTKSETVEIKTDLFVAQVSAQGGDMVGLELNKYKATGDKSQNFKLLETGHQYAAQSGLLGANLPNHKTVFRIVPGQRDLSANEETLQLRLEAPTVDGVKVAKIYTFKRGSYLIDVAYEIANGSQQTIAANAYYQVQRDDQSPAGESRGVSTFTGVAQYTEEGKYKKIDFKDIEKGSAKFEQKADNGWIAMVQHYFVSAWIPQEMAEREFYTRKARTQPWPQESSFRCRRLLREPRQATPRRSTQARNSSRCSTNWPNPSPMAESARKGWRLSSTMDG
jgi:YidC/Oxa1 family membrane protein insertase